MKNPFEIIESRLCSIENLILDLKHHPKEDKSHKNSEQLFTVRETANFLNLTIPTIYSKVSKGELPFMKRSKRLYFSSTELMDYLKKGRKKTNTEIEDDADAYLSNKKSTAL